MLSYNKVIGYKLILILSIELFNNFLIIISTLFMGHQNYLQKCFIYFFRIPHNNASYLKLKNKHTYSEYKLIHKHTWFLHLFLNFTFSRVANIFLFKNTYIFKLKRF